MKKEFVTPQIAKKLKELGFDKKCMAAYLQDDNLELNVKEFPRNLFKDSDGYHKCSAPLWQQAIDWLMSEKRIFILESVNRNGESAWYIEMPEPQRGKITYLPNSYTDYKPDRNLSGREQTILKALKLLS